MHVFMHTHLAISARTLVGIAVSLAIVHSKPFQRQNKGTSAKWRPVSPGLDANAAVHTLRNQAGARHCRTLACT